LAEQGDAFAQYRLGKYYAKQKGRQAPESISWYQKASPGLRRLAEAGNGQAMYVLGVMYAYGRGVTRNTEEARHWLSQAVRHNVTAARPVLDGLEAREAVDRKAKNRGPSPPSPR
jgi:TPR repeat protein